MPSRPSRSRPGCRAATAQGHPWSLQPPARSTTVMPPTMTHTDAPTSPRSAKLRANSSLTEAKRGSHVPVRGASMDSTLSCGPDRGQIGRARTSVEAVVSPVALIGADGRRRRTTRQPTIESHVRRPRSGLRAGRCRVSHPSMVGAGTFAHSTTVPRCTAPEVEVHGGVGGVLRVVGVVGHASGGERLQAVDRRWVLGPGSERRPHPPSSGTFWSGAPWISRAATGWARLHWSTTRSPAWTPIATTLSRPGTPTAQRAWPRWSDR